MTSTPPNLADQHKKVPSEWPPICVAPERATRRISDPVVVAAMVGLWFLPKRVGAIVATASWRATLIAHTIGIGFGLGLIAWAEHISSVRSMFKQALPPGWPQLLFHFPTPIYGEASGLEWLRSPFAALVTTVHGSGTFVVSGLTLPWAFVGLESAAMAAALVAAPFATAGETTRLVLGRSIKLSLWSTTMLLPLGVGWMCDPYARTLLKLPDEWHPLDFVALAIFAVWWLVVLLRSGSTYVGPAEGPLWEPRCPRCESCGYLIVHLDVAGRCPECARPIAMSLADRRRVPHFTDAVGLPGKTKALFSTIRAAIAEKSFFDGLAIQRGRREARIFFILVAALNSGLLSIALSLNGVLPWERDHLGDTAAEIVVVACLCLFVQLAIAALLAWSIAVVAKRAFCTSATVVFYGWACVLPAAAALVFLLLAAFVLGWAVSVNTGFVGRSVAALAIAFAFAGAGLTLLSTVRIVRSALKDTRFANG